MPDGECGYVYAALGEKYVEEAAASARSLREVDGSAHITLITSTPGDRPEFDETVMQPAEENDWNAGVLYRISHLFDASPYDRTFYVDGDTYFGDECRHLFRLLDHFDLLITMAPKDIKSAHIRGEELLGCQPYNVGVMVFRRNARNEHLFRRWTEIFAAKIQAGTLGRENDQTSFMEALLESESRIFVLRNNYNARLPYALGLNGRVRIVHGRADDMRSAYEAINATEAERVWDPENQRCLAHRDIGVWRQFRRNVRNLFTTGNLRGTRRVDRQTTR